MLYRKYVDLKNGVYVLNKKIKLVGNWLDICHQINKRDRTKNFYQNFMGQWIKGSHSREDEKNVKSWIFYLFEHYEKYIEKFEKNIEN